MSEQVEKKSSTYMVADGNREDIAVAHTKRLDDPEVAKEIAKSFARSKGGVYEVWKRMTIINGGSIKPKPIPEGQCQCLTCGSLVALRNQKRHAEKAHGGELNYRENGFQENISYSP